MIAADGIHSRVARALARRREGQLHRPRRLPHHVSGRVARRLRDRPMLQVVGTGPPHRHLLRHRQPRRGLFRHQRAGARIHGGVLVGDRRSRQAPRGVRRLPRAGPARRARLPARAQMGDRRSRSPAPLERRRDGAARRRRPSDDAIHGAGRGDRDGGRRRAQPLHRGAAGRPRRRRSPATRRRGASAPRASRAPRRRTPSCASRPTRTGSTATTPGPRRCRNTREIARLAGTGKLIRAARALWRA